MYNTVDHISVIEFIWRLYLNILFIKFCLKYLKSEPYIYPIMKRKIYIPILVMYNPILIVYNPILVIYNPILILYNPIMIQLSIYYPILVRIGTYYPFTIPYLTFTIFLPTPLVTP